MRQHFDRRAAAHRAIDKWFDAREPSLNRSQAAEADRYSRMKRRQDAGETSFLDTGDLGHTERHWPVVSACTMWQLVVRGSDHIAGSVKAGYELRHGTNADRESQ
jgi:hypothetical protein